MQVSVTDIYLKVFFTLAGKLKNRFGGLEDAWGRLVFKTTSQQPFK